MPKRRYRKKRTRKYAKRKRRYKKRRRKRSLAPLLSTRGILPRSCVRRLRFTSNYSASLTNGVTSGVEVGYYLHDLLDPDGTSGAHQPYGYDQMKAFYYNYLVTGATLRASIRHGNNSGTESVYYSYIRIDDSDNLGVTPADWSDARETPKIFPKLSKPDGTNVTHHSYRNMNLQKFANKGMTDTKNTLVGVLGPTAASPGSSVICWVGIGNTVNDNTSAFSVAVEVEYTVKFFDPIEIAPS